MPAQDIEEMIKELGRRKVTLLLRKALKEQRAEEIPDNREQIKALLKKLGINTTKDLIDAVRKARAAMKGGDEAMSPDKPA